MPATVFEVSMALITSALAAAGTAAGTRVYRGLLDELAVDEAPAIVLRREDTTLQDQLVHGDPEHQLVFSLSAVCTGDTWEAACDTLHQQAHAALIATPALQVADIELRSTAARAQAGAVTVGSITAQYALTLQPGENLT